MALSRRKFVIASVGAIAAASFGASPAFAGSSYGPQVSMQSGNTTYYGKAFTGTSGDLPKGTIMTHASRVVDAGWIGAKAMIYGGSTGRLINASTGYSASAMQYFNVQTTAYSRDPLYHYTAGYLYGWNGNSAYKTCYVSQTPNTYSLQSANYPTNDLGMTYGSLLDEPKVGYAPDLISAVGTGGKAGFVKLDDLLDSPETPQAAIALMEAKQDIIIPVFATDGIRIVDEFRIEIADCVAGC